MPVREVEIRGYQIKIGEKGYKSSDLDSRKNETIEELKREEYNHLEGIVFRMESTYSEIEETFDTKYIAKSSKRYTFPPGIYEITVLK